jgi:hypothetical protein
MRIFVRLVFQPVRVDDLRAKQQPTRDGLAGAGGGLCNVQDPLDGFERILEDPLEA